MSSLTAKSQLAFELPNLTYVGDAHVEDPILPPPAKDERPHGMRALLLGFRMWREKQAALSEMEMMSDHELADIGLSRSDLTRVFNDNFNSDLRQRGAA